MLEPLDNHVDFEHHHTKISSKTAQTFPTDLCTCSSYLLHWLILQVDETPVEIFLVEVSLEALTPVNALKSHLILWIAFLF